MNGNSTLLRTVQGIQILQDPPVNGNGGRIHYVAGLEVDVDGAEKAYRFDNVEAKGALDDIIHSAGYPNEEWWNVLARDPRRPNQPFIDPNGFCVSMTSYQRDGFSSLDRKRYLDASIIPYSVTPGSIRKPCKGVLLGCKAKITDIVTDEAIETVCGDFSGNSCGESSLAAARHFDPTLSARNGDDRKRFLYEFWPDVPAFLEYGNPPVTETFKLIRMA